MEDDNGGDEYDYEYEDEEDIDDDQMEPGAGEAGGEGEGATGGGSARRRSSSVGGAEDLTMRDETVAFVDQAQLKSLMSKVVADIRCGHVSFGIRNNTVKWLPSSMGYVCRGV